MGLGVEFRLVLVLVADFEGKEDGVDPEVDESEVKEEADADDNEVQDEVEDIRPIKFTNESR